MIHAHALEAVEVTIDGYHDETPNTNNALREAGFTSLVVRYKFDRKRTEFHPEHNPRPSGAPTHTIVIGVGRSVGKIDGARGEARPLQAFAAWARNTDEIREHALALGIQTLAWRCYAAKVSHLPALEPPPDADARGRWFVCYAERDEALPEGIALDG